MYREAIKQKTGPKDGLCYNITEIEKLTTGTSRAYTLARLKREWLPWCRENLRFSRQTADNYRRIYNDRDKLLTVGNLDLTEAYRLLSQPTCNGRGEAGEFE